MAGLPGAQEVIARALAPGVAVTALVLYNTSLQNRFIYITARLREIDREARQLIAEGTALHAARLASLRRQATIMTKRSRMLRRAVLFVYGCFGSFVATIVCLAGSLIWPSLDGAAVLFFVGGFGILGGAGLLSASEMYQALLTMDEDVRSSFASAPASAAVEPPSEERTTSEGGEP